MEDRYEEMWVYVALASRHVVGFFGVLGVLTCKKSWRIAYYRFVDEMIDSLWVFAATKRQIALHGDNKETKKKQWENGAHIYSISATELPVLEVRGRNVHGDLVGHRKHIYNGSPTTAVIMALLSSCIPSHISSFPSSTHRSQAAVGVNMDGPRLPRHFRCHASGQGHVMTADQAATENRRSANYMPSVWDYDSLQTLRSRHELNKLIRIQVKVFSTKCSAPTCGNIVLD
ncbi:hypothetical protein ACLOJK_009641 [Asimina triloba]